MKILHTADWHLGDRLGRIDRTDDLRRAVERVGAYCEAHAIDVLLVAGDLFSELARPDGLRDAIRHLQATFRDFLHRGGTILALTGNHDNEGFCQTLRHAMGLAAPVADAPGELVAPGRLYLAHDPTFLRLRDPSGAFDVQFIMLPYPTPTRYLTDEANQRYASLEEKNRALVSACVGAMHDLRRHDRFDPRSPTVLAAHFTVSSASLGGLFRISEEQDVVIDDGQFPPDLAYVALGHIHKPQFLGGKTHVRYSGSIERMDLGEKDDHKSVVVFEVGPDGRAGEPRLLPLDATPVYELDVLKPADDLPYLREQYADAANDLVNLHVRYTAGDNLDQVLRDLDSVFPRWYARDWRETSELGQSISPAEPARARSFEETVREYLAAELTNHSDEERAAVLERAERLLADV